MILTAVIDRWEGSKAVLLAGDREEAVLWPRALLPEGVKEGDILQLSLTIDREATRQAKEEAETLLRQLLSQNGQADK